MKTIMNKIKTISMLALPLTLALGMSSCKNGDPEFDDYEGGTTVYFSYQDPVRTIVLGDDVYDTSMDKEHKCKIKATFGGSYNGANASVDVAVDNSLVDHLFFSDGSPVKAMPESYYKLSSNTIQFKGDFSAGVDVQLTDAFFNDPEAVKTTYVIPLVMTGQKGFGKINTGMLKEGAQGARTNPNLWEVAPKDYVLYCVKFQNKYSGWWLTNHSTSTDNIEKANQVQVTTKGLYQSVYTVEYSEGKNNYKADLLLTFDQNDKCTISSLTPGVTATGNGSWGDNIMKQAWGQKDRDGMNLKYEITFADGYKKSVDETLVFMRSGVTSQEFAPVYK